MNLPVDTIDRHVDELAGTPTVLYCRSGMRSRQAADVLARGGLDDVHDLGSLDRWDTNT